jgi:hypothetical protein
MQSYMSMIIYQEYFREWDGVVIKKIEVVPGK